MIDDATVIDQATCPLASCRAIPGEPCWHTGEHTKRSALYAHYERRQVYAAKIKGEPLGLPNCPICGVDSPHAHTAVEQSIPATVAIELPGLFVYEFDRTNPRHLARITSFLWRTAVKMLHPTATTATTDGIATGLSRALVALEARALHEAAGVVRELLEAAVDP